MSPALRIANATIAAPGGRILFDALTIHLSRGERVALVGRNGVGKSTLLAHLAEHAGPSAHFVPQVLRGKMSPGELRREALTNAFRAAPDVLLLDEPTSDLDDDGLAWLRAALERFEGAVLVATHDRRLLADFREFFVASEAGSRGFRGTLDALDVELEREHRIAEARYAARLRELAAAEEHALSVARRRARKKRYGRCREIDRATPRMRLNAKRGQAQVNHGKDAQLREARSKRARDVSLAMRRALTPSLELTLPTLDLGSASRARIGVVGANGSGKTALLDDLRRAMGDDPRIGAIAQGATDYLRAESLVEILAATMNTLDEVVHMLVAQAFPIALAERPLASLSPGERTRAALITLFRRSLVPEWLVLDEPTYSLDLVGQRALTNALAAYPGGLIVASHDRTFLERIGIEHWVSPPPR